MLTPDCYIHLYIDEAVLCSLYGSMSLYKGVMNSGYQQYLVIIILIRLVPRSGLQCSMNAREIIVQHVVKLGTGMYVGLVV